MKNAINQWRTVSRRCYLLLLIVLITMPLSTWSFIKHGREGIPVRQAYIQKKISEPEYQEKLAEVFFKASAKEWYFHLIAFLAMTFFIALCFRFGSIAIQTYIFFPLSFIPLGIAAFFFVNAELLADTMSDANKAQYMPEIAAVKICSLLIGIFSGGFSFEMAKVCFFESRENRVS